MGLPGSTEQQRRTQQPRASRSATGSDESCLPYRLFTVGPPRRDLRANHESFWFLYLRARDEQGPASSDKPSPSWPGSQASAWLDASAPAALPAPLL
jgi:hypothetical protein